MKRYKSHKIVQAGRIVSIERNKMTANDPLGSGVHVVVEGGEKFTIYGSQFDRAEVGGYLILYPDGYRSYSPAGPFEDGYTELPEASSQVDQSMALKSQSAHGRGQAQLTSAVEGRARGDKLIRRHHALELVLRTPGITGHHDALRAAREYEKYLEGNDEA